MRGTGRIATILLIILSLGGIIVAVLFLRNETKLAQERQTVVARLSAELEPINEERNEWQVKDEEWRNTLAEKKQGTSCVILCFDDMGEELFNTVFKMMDAYGFKAVFSLKNGKIPTSEENYIGAEEFQEMLDSGWEYAISFAKEAVSIEETGDILETEESVFNIVTEVPTGTSWLTQIDSFLSYLVENQLSVPEILFCTQEQYESVSDSDLMSRGFHIVRVLDTENFPYISELNKDLWKIDSGLYSQKNQLGNQIDMAVQNGESIAISINKVLNISQDAEYDLNSSKLGSLLGSLKSMEEQDMVHVFTFSEYYQYAAQEAKEYKALLSQYASFRSEMNEAVEALDQQELKLVEEARNTVAQ